MKVHKKFVSVDEELRIVLEDNKLIISTKAVPHHLSKRVYSELMLRHLNFLRTPTHRWVDFNEEDDLIELAKKIVFVLMPVWSAFVQMT